MLTIKIDEQGDDEWNQNLLNSSLGTIFQTKERATYLKSMLGSDSLFLKFYDEDNLVAQLLAFYTPRITGKVTKIFGRGKLYSLFKSSNFFPRYLHWLYGPVIFDDSYRDKVSEALGNFIISKKYSFIGSPHPLDSNFCFPSKFNFNQSKNGTFIINLINGIEDITKNYNKKSTIKNIQRAKKRGVIVTEIQSDEDILQYYKLQKQTRIKNNLIPYSLEDIEKGLKISKSLGATGFLAWLGEKLTGGIIINSFNGYIVQSGSARSELDSSNKLHSQDLLKWHVIEWGIKNKCRFYDLAGIKLTDRNDKEEGIYIHKKKWGGKLYEYYTFKNF